MKGKTTWWQLPDPGKPQLLRARFQTQVFSRHSHEHFAIGVIEAGGLAFQYRGQDVLAPAGWVNLAYPGEVHTGRAAGPEGWTYRMFYLDPAQVLEVAQDLNPSCKTIPFLPMGALEDADLASRVFSLHRLCEDPTSDPLVRQIELGRMIQTLLIRYGSSGLEQNSHGVASTLHLAKQHLEDLFDRPIQLQDLALVTGMNPYRLVRHFTREFGLPPHAYLVQVRVRRAAALLRKGLPPVQAAIETGFADQSHLHRHFLKTFGVTPGAYGRIFRKNRITG